MTPEQLTSTCVMFRKEMEVQGASMGIMSVFDSMCSYLGGESRDLNRALAAIGEAHQTIALKQSNIETLTGQLVDETALHAKTAAKLIAAERVIVRQREALEFYSEVGNYQEHIIDWGPEIPVLQDSGKRARASLGEGATADETQI